MTSTNVVLNITNIHKAPAVKLHYRHIHHRDYQFIDSNKLLIYNRQLLLGNLALKIVPPTVQIARCSQPVRSFVRSSVIKLVDIIF